MFLLDFKYFVSIFIQIVDFYLVGKCDLIKWMFTLPAVGLCCVVVSLPLSAVGLCCVVVSLTLPAVGLCCVVVSL